MSINSSKHTSLVWMIQIHPNYRKTSTSQNLLPLELCLYFLWTLWTPVDSELLRRKKSRVSNFIATHFLLSVKNKTICLVIFTRSMKLKLCSILQLKLRKYYLTQLITNINLKQNIACNVLKKRSMLRLNSDYQQ